MGCELNRYAPSGRIESPISSLNVAVIRASSRLTNIGCFCTYIVLTKGKCLIRQSEHHYKRIPVNRTRETLSARQSIRNRASVVILFETVDFSPQTTVAPARTATQASTSHRMGFDTTEKLLMMFAVLSDRAVLAQQRLLSRTAGSSLAPRLLDRLLNSTTTTADSHGCEQYHSLSEPSWYGLIQSVVSLNSSLLRRLLSCLDQIVRHPHPRPWLAASLTISTAYSKSCS